MLDDFDTENLNTSEEGGKKNLEEVESPMKHSLKKERSLETH